MTGSNLATALRRLQCSGSLHILRLHGRTRQPPAAIGIACVVALAFALGLWSGHVGSIDRARTLTPVGLINSNAVAGAAAGLTAHRKKATAFLAIQSSAAVDSALRRDAVRSTWLGHHRTWEDVSIAAAFVIGNTALCRQLHGGFFERYSDRIPTLAKDETAFATAGRSEDVALRAEAAHHGDMVFLPTDDVEARPAYAALMLFAFTQEAYNVDYVIKVQDTSYVRLGQLSRAISDWHRTSAGYVGCMKRTDVVRDARSVDYEPSHLLLSKVYYRHASGHAYAVSREAVALLTSVPAPFWRSFVREDVSVGAWLLALAVVHRDDRRMCSDSCTQGVVLWDAVRTAPADALTHMQHLQSLCQEREQHINEAQLVEAALRNDATETS